MVCQGSGDRTIPMRNRIWLALYVVRTRRHQELWRSDAACIAWPPQKAAFPQPNSASARYISMVTALSWIMSKPRAGTGPPAGHGNAEAAYNLGFALCPGNRHAAKLSRRPQPGTGKSAEMGYASAQLNLGVLYFAGQGLPKNAAEAAKWTRLAAQQGNGHAQFNLATLYLQGQGVPRSLPRAFVWFSAAAANLSGKQAQIATAQSQTIASSMTLEQKIEAKTVAEACKSATTRRLRLAPAGDKGILRTVLPAAQPNLNACHD